MKQRSKPPVVVEIHRSKILTIFIHALHVLLLLVLIFCGLDFGLLIAVMGAVALSWYLSWYDHLRPFQPKRVLLLKIMPDETWKIMTEQGGCTELKLKSHMLFKHLAIVHFQPQKSGLSHILLLSDSFDRESFRQLRVRLNEVPESGQKSLLGR